MNEAFKNRIRPFVLPCIHGWQTLHDYSLRKFYEYRDRLRILRSGTVILQDSYGIRFVLYPFDRPNFSYLVRRPFDGAEFQVIPSLVHPGDTTLDIGANAGLYSVLLSRLCGPTGRVWAFEPVPDTYWRLRENLVLNRCENVIPVQAAINDKSGSATMNLFEPRFAEWNTLSMPPPRTVNRKSISPSQSVQVSAYDLDQFCDAQSIERIHFLKVDVEGLELSVFRGAERMLREQRVDYICFEIAKALLKSEGVESRQVFEVLEGHGYSIFRFDTAVQRFQGPIHDTSEVWTNFFASWRDLSHLEHSDSPSQSNHLEQEESAMGNRE